MTSDNEMWSYDEGLQADESDWVGFQVHATDGDIGKVDEMTASADRGSLVVDTGPWIFGKKRLIPAATVQSVDRDAQRVDVGLSKEQIKHAPDYDKLRAHDATQFDDHTTYYGRYF